MSSWPIVVMSMSQVSKVNYQFSLELPVYNKMVNMTVVYVSESLKISERVSLMNAIIKILIKP